jgi:dihydropyrimidinase
MALYDLLILNGIVVTDTEIGEKDIAIKDEKISEVVPKGTLSEATAKRTINAKGGYVMVSWL